jgi:plastocyanin
MSRFLPILLACAALAFAGCGGDDEESTEPAATATPEQTQSSGGGGGGDGGTVTVTMKDIQFQPSDVTVKVGGKIKWVNEDSVDHDAVAKEGDVPKSELFGKGGSYEATFDTAGTIDYVCTVHPGMEGTITVQ